MGSGRPHPGSRHSRPGRSVINYGLAMTGPHVPAQECQDLDKVALNPAARTIAGAGFATRRKTLHVMADTMTMINHYILKTANMLDRTLKAEGTYAKTNVEEFASRYYALTGGGGRNSEYFPKWRKIVEQDREGYQKRGDTLLGKEKDKEKQVWGR